MTATLWSVFIGAAISYWRQRFTPEEVEKQEKRKKKADINVLVKQRYRKKLNDTMPEVVDAIVFLTYGTVPKAARKTIKEEIRREQEV